MMAQPEMNGSEFEHGEEVCGVLLVARSQSSEVFDAVEEPLDAVARPVEHSAEAGLPARMRHRRDVGRGASGFDLATQLVGVISLVGQHDRVLAQMAEPMGGNRTVASLARCQDQFERQAAGIGQSVDLGRQPAEGAAHTAIRVAFFELAAC